MRTSIFTIIFLSLVINCNTFITAQDSVTDGIYNIQRFGARGDGTFLNTKAIQSAIDKAAENGGGVIYFPPGTYLSGSINLKDFITLRMEAGAVLLGSKDMKDYPSDLGRIEMHPGVFFAGPLVYAENAQYVGIEGRGIINGQGTRDVFIPLPQDLLRPGLVRFKNCRFVTVKDISLINAARWTMHIRDCEDVTVSNIYLNSNLNRNNDGIDIDGSQRVKITGCYITSGDDAIVLKSFNPGYVRDIVIADCILSSQCSAIKIGTETVGTFENISISNCAIFGSRGINLFTMDGSDINNITVSNISMRDCKSAIQLRLGGRMRPYFMPLELQPKNPGRLRNIMMSNIQAVNIQESQDFISGIPGYNIENVVMTDIRISYSGGGTREQSLREIPEAVEKYPKIGMFGDLPSYGFYIRHVDGIELRNIHLSYSERDLRPAIVCENVNDLEIINSKFSGEKDGESTIRLNQVKNAIIKENRVKDNVPLFLKVQGNSEDIMLIGNYMQNVAKMFDLDKSVRLDNIKELNNFR